jgi:hypothetical protein
MTSTSDSHQPRRENKLSCKTSYTRIPHDCRPADTGTDTTELEGPPFTLRRNESTRNGRTTGRGRTANKKDAF